MPRSTPPPPPPADAQRFPIDDLLAWYARHRRDLPWRTDAGLPDPYHVFISEAMAQQTQIATVIPYFHRFLEAFPTVTDLAEADEQRVLTLWQGLGYYRRARNLHAAAKKIVADHAGRVPSDVDDLLALPGVGRYTAGAVASVAHGRPAPIVDGNVARVFARVFLIDAAIDQPATLKTLWHLADTLVHRAAEPAAGVAKPVLKKRTGRNRVGDFNQSLMELGALICTPKSPACLVCPLREACRAHAAGRAAALPIKTPKKKPTAVTHTVLAVHRRGRYLFEQRPATGLWSNMWQLPTLETAGDPAEHLRQRFGLTITPPEPRHRFTHQTTHRTIQFDLVHCNAAAGRLKPKTGQWRSLAHLDDLPLPNPQRIAVAHLTDTHR